MGPFTLAKAVTEFTGTLFLCLTVALTGGSAIAPIAIGCVLMVMVYAGGHVSGAHYNPAVTMSILVRGKIRFVDSIAYVVSQILGGLCGSALAWPLIGKDNAVYPRMAASATEGEALLAEFMITFALCSVVLHTATTKLQANNSYYGLAIGFTVLSGAVSVGGISGGAFNPAVGLTAVLYGSSDAWLYWVAPLAAGLSAGGVFRLVARGEWCLRPLPESIFLVEVIGTMMLCYTVGTAAVTTSALVPLSIGSMLMSMVYMGGATSGAHYNPAVTGAIWLRSVFLQTDDGFDQCKKVQYILAQVCGSMLGTWAAKFTTGGAVGHPNVGGGSEAWSKAALAEFVGTFVLAYVVLNVATVRALLGNSFFGLAIGMTVTAMACALGPVSGGAFNPAVALIGLVTTGIDFDKFALVYWLPEAFGGLAASLFFRLQNTAEFAGVRAVAYTAHVAPAEARPRYMVHATVDAQPSGPHGARKASDDGNAEVTA